LVLLREVRLKGRALGLLSLLLLNLHVLSTDIVPIFLLAIFYIAAGVLVTIQVRADVVAKLCRK
jgi:hypothetical protein